MPCFPKKTYNPRARLPPDHPVHPYDSGALDFARSWLAHVEAGRIGAPLFRPSDAGRRTSVRLGYAP